MIHSIPGSMLLVLPSLFLRVDEGKVPEKKYTKGNLSKHKMNGKICL